MALISSAFFPGSLLHVNEADSRAFEDKSKLPGNSVVPRDDSSPVIKTLSPNAQKLLGRANLLESSAYPPKNDAQTKPSVGQQLIQTLASSGANLDDINSLAESAQKNQNAIDDINNLQKNLLLSKKNDASLRLDFAREQLRILRLLEKLGTDPKIIAHSAADIGREVASAAKEYADAGKASADNLAPDVSTQDDASAVSPNAGTLSNVDTSQTDVSASNVKPDTAGESAQAEQKNTSSEIVSKVSVSYSASITYSASNPNADAQEFAQEVKELFAKAGALLRHAIEHSKQKKSSDSELDKIKDQFASASREAADSIKSILGETASSGSGEDPAIAVETVNIQVDVQVSAASVDIVV